MNLPVINARDLPRLAYAHGKDHDPALTEPEKFRQVINDRTGPKPLGGGLWTAPVTRTDHQTEEILSTAWTDWCRSEHSRPEMCTDLLEIAPLRGFKGLRIDSLDDARAVLEQYRLTPEPGYLSNFWAVFNWEQMAADGYDGLYLTDEGQWATRLPEDKTCAMYSWDAASVLWLRPTYRVVS